MYTGMETANVITSIATVISWGLSFIGVHRYMRSYAHHYDNGFPMILSVLVSVGVGILAATASSMLLTGRAGLLPLDMSLAMTAIAVVVIWGISFVGIYRYIRSHAPHYDNGFAMILSVLVGVGAGILAATAASNISTIKAALQPPEIGMVIAATAAVVIWGISFVGIYRYLKPYSANYDNGFTAILSVLVSVGMGILTAAVAGRLLTEPAALPPIEMGLVVTATAAVVVWGISFIGIYRYLKPYSANYDNGFTTILSVLASVGMGILTAAVASTLLTEPTALPPIEMSLVVTAIAVVVVWGISFAGIHKYLRSHATGHDNGFYMALSVAASIAVAIVAAALASKISVIQTPSADLGYGLTPVDLGLALIALAVLIGPFTVKKIEHNLEVFLFVMGVLAVTVAGVWEMRLVEEAVMEPVVKGIVPAVLTAGVLFHYGRSYVHEAMDAIQKAVPLKVIVFVMIVVLGLASSIMTAIIASLLLVELVNCLPLDRNAKINLVVVSCFSIGLGAVLTPLGEPLSTIAVSKLQGPPYHANFFFLFDQLAGYVIPGVLAMGVIGTLFVRKATAGECVTTTAATEGLRDVGIRAAKVYAFVMALLLLGGGMKIIIDKYFIAIPSEALYWVNMLSAILDNATLTAAEIAPSLSMPQISAALMGLLVAGGMLIPGNIPNIIAANKLGITSKEWARLGIPLGLVTMLVYFVWVFYLPFKPSLGF